MASPKRVFLRFHEKHIFEETQILNTYFSEYPKATDDYCTHLCAANLSPQMHILIDFHYKAFPNIDVHTIEHEVFQVQKDGDL